MIKESKKFIKNIFISVWNKDIIVEHADLCPPSGLVPLQFFILFLVFATEITWPCSRMGMWQSFWILIIFFHMGRFDFSRFFLSCWLDTHIIADQVVTTIYRNAIKWLVTVVTSVFWLMDVREANLTPHLRMSWNNKKK